MLDINNYLTASGSYPDRASSKELTPELLTNAKALIMAVNNLLKDLNISSVRVSSGFRPSAVNGQIANAAKKSLHQQCLAVDILDSKDQTIAKLIESKPELLKKHGLWMEHKDSTKGQYTNWVHLDLGKRVDRPVRIFKP